MVAFVALLLLSSHPSLLPSSLHCPCPVCCYLSLSSLPHHRASFSFTLSLKLSRPFVCLHPSSPTREQQGKALHKSSHQYNCELVAVISVRSDVQEEEFWIQLYSGNARPLAGTPKGLDLSPILPDNSPSLRGALAIVHDGPRGHDFFKAPRHPQFAGLLRRRRIARGRHGFIGVHLLLTAARGSNLVLGFDLPPSETSCSTTTTSVFTTFLQQLFSSSISVCDQHSHNRPQRVNLCLRREDEFDCQLLQSPVIYSP